MREIKKLEQLMAHFDHHVVLMGASANAWGLDKRFDTYSDMVRAELSKRQINWITGNDLAIRLTYPTIEKGYSSDDRWHAERTTENAEHMVEYMKMCYKYGACNTNETNCSPHN